MSIRSFQKGIANIAANLASETVTLSTPVTQANTIVLFSLRGGSNSISSTQVKAVLSADGTQLTFNRHQQANNLIIIEYQVVESAFFTCQHVDQNIPDSGISNITINEVDLSQAFIIPSGFTNSGSSRAGDDFGKISFGDQTTVEIDCAFGATNRQVSFIVVEMPNTVINSIQYTEITQFSDTLDTSISAVDETKTLTFMTGIDGGGNVNNSNLPITYLTTPTNLRSEVVDSNTNFILGVFIVEFNSLVVTHNTALNLASLSTNETLSSAPTYGGALVNGLNNQFGNSDQLDDDQDEVAFTASLVSDTWVFTRASSTSIANLSYSVFDWLDLFAGAVDINIDITGLANPTEVRIYSAGTTSEIIGEENVTSGEFTGVIPFGIASVDISILSLEYQNIRLENINTTFDRSIPVSQRIDRQYLNP